MAAITILCGLYLAFSYFSALVKGEGGNVIYLDNSTTWNLGLSGDIYSHTGYPNIAGYLEILDMRLNLTGLLYSGVTSVLVVKFSDPFSIPNQESSCTGDHLYLAGLVLCDAITPAPDHYISRLLQPQIATVTYIVNPVGRSDRFHFYYAVAAPIRNRTSHDSVQEIWEGEGYITSHSTFPENYASSINSSLTLRGLKPNQTVSITFLSFDIYYHENYPDCNEDYLQIHRVNGTQSVKFCGSPNHKPQLNEPYLVIPDGDDITFRFVTNSGNSFGSGFFFSYMVATSLETSPLPSKVGSSTSSALKPSATSTLTVTAKEAHTATQKSLIGSTETEGQEDKDNSHITYIAVGSGAGGLLLVILVTVIIIVSRRRRDNPTSSAQCNTPTMSRIDKQGPNKDESGKTAFTTAKLGATGHSFGNCEAQVQALVSSDYELGDEYQLAGPISDGYDNSLSTRRAEEDKTVTDVYAVVNPSTKKKNTRLDCQTTELVDNDLYGT